MLTYNVEYTDTFGGEANYCWVERVKVRVLELTHFGYDGATGYAEANERMERTLVRRAKAALGLQGVRCKRDDMGETIVLRPCGSSTVVFIDYCEK